MNRIEAVIRVFNQYGNRKNKQQGAAEIRDARARLRLARGADRKGIPGHPDERRDRVAGHGSRGIRRLSVEPAAARQWRAAAGGERTTSGDPDYDRLARDQREAAEADGLRGGDGAGGAGQPDGAISCAALAVSPPTRATARCGSRSSRTWCWRSSRWRGCRGCTRRLQQLGLAEAGREADRRRASRARARIPAISR